MNNKLRYAIVIIIGIVMNEILYKTAEVLNLPVWIDTSGTILAAIALEPTAGLIVGLVNNFFLAIFVYDSSSMIYYSVSAAVALIAGICMVKNGKLKINRIIPTIGLIILASSFLSTAMAIWRSGAVPNSYWELFYYNHALAWGIPKVLACFIGVFIIKIYDTVVTALIVAVVYIILPKKLKNPVEQ